jgi:L-fucose isomerase-like protein
MAKRDRDGFPVDRRNFIKTTTIAGMAAALPATSLLSQTTEKAVKARRSGGTKRLLLVNDAPSEYGQLMESLKAIKGVDIIPATAANFRTPQEIVKSVQSQDPDIIVMSLPRIGMSYGSIANDLGNLTIPVIVFPQNPDLMMLDADMAAALRIKGVNALFANSQARAAELIKIVAAPGVLEGKRAIIYGRPFDSTSVQARNLNEEYIYQRTGVKIQYRPIEELKSQLESITEASAQKELERWKKEAVSVVEATDKGILDTCRLYILLRSIIDKEGLAGVSIDCLNFSFNSDRLIPLPCLAFTRLRDEGVAAPCEADVVGMLSSMLLQEVSKRPSYFCNVSEVNSQNSHVVLRHCVAPLKLLGRDAPALKYRIRDYHGLGGATPEVEFPVGLEVTMGGFTKDLKNFVSWPGRIQPQKMDTDRPSFAGATGASAKMRKYCSNRAEVEVKEVERFLQNIAEIHYTLVAGSYTNALSDEMLRLNTSVVGPLDAKAPEKT